MTSTQQQDTRTELPAATIKAECEHYVRSGDAIDLNEAAEIVAPMCGKSWREVFEIATSA